MIDFISSSDAKVLKDLATSLGIIFGGMWAFWKWSLSEYFKKRNEIPSIDGELVWELTSLSKKQDALTVTCNWRNAGKVVLPVNTKETRFTVYELENDVEVGAIDTKHGSHRVYADHKPWEKWPAVVLEPSTTSKLVAHFVLERRKTYIIVCRLEAATKPSKYKQVWTREIIWNHEVTTET